jgi:hypothetical protein
MIGLMIIWVLLVIGLACDVFVFFLGGDDE